MAKHGIDTFISIISRSTPQATYRTRKYIEASDQTDGRVLCIIWPEHFRCSELLGGGREDLAIQAIALHLSMLPCYQPTLRQDGQHTTDLSYHCGWARGEQAEQLDVRRGDVALVAEAQATF